MTQQMKSNLINWAGTLGILLTFFFGINSIYAKDAEIKTKIDANQQLATQSMLQMQTQQKQIVEDIYRDMAIQSLNMKIYNLTDKKYQLKELSRRYPEDQGIARDLVEIEKTLADAQKDLDKKITGQ